MATSPSEIKNLLSSGRTEDAIERLLRITKNTAWHDEVVQQSARFREWQRAKRSGAVPASELDLKRNQINAALLEIMNGMSDNPPAAIDFSVWGRLLKTLGVIVAIVAGLIFAFNSIGGSGARGGNSNSITVLVHGKSGKDDIVLPGRGIVYLIYGNAKVPETLNNEGEVTFKQIPEAVFAEGARVELLFEDPDGEPYRAARPDSQYAVDKGEYIALEVVLEGIDRLEGTVKDFVTGEPLDSVMIRIRGYSFYSNTFGEFTIEIPEERQRQFIDITAVKDGYQRWELSNVPTTTDKPIVIGLKPQ